MLTSINIYVNRTYLDCILQPLKKNTLVSKLHFNFCFSNNRFTLA